VPERQSGLDERHLDCVVHWVSSLKEALAPTEPLVRAELQGLYVDRWAGLTAARTQVLLLVATQVGLGLAGSKPAALSMLTWSSGDQPVAAGSCARSRQI
jgi:hypothetical protein